MIAREGAKEAGRAAQGGQRRLTRGRPAGRIDRSGPFDHENRRRKRTGADDCTHYNTINWSSSLVGAGVEDERAKHRDSLDSNEFSPNQMKPDRIQRGAIRSQSRKRPEL